MKPTKNLITYTLLQLPGQFLFAFILILLKDLLSIPLWLVILLIVLWIAKDVVLYRWIGHAYGPSESDKAQSMIGRRGTTYGIVDPSGYVQVNSELWRAEVRQGSGRIAAGTAVEVKARNGLTLIVEPVDDGP